MNSSNKNYSYLFSITIHSLIIIVFSFLRCTTEPEIDDYVTIGFGSIGTQSSSGQISEQIVEEDKKEEEVKNEDKQKEKVELPTAQNTDENNIVTTDKNKDEPAKPAPQPVENIGQENEGEESGNFGFEIDFGGKGKRRIYSSPLPSYPEGVSKEIDIKLRFSILPDGTVGTIIPLIKADTRLEMAAIYSLRQWRFEPLPKSVNQAAQTAIIIFPYRLQ